VGRRTARPGSQNFRMARNASSARKGKAVEHLVAATCVLGSRGELNALTALVDDEGVDLSLKRRDGTRTLDLQVKSAFVDERANLRDHGKFIADVRRETFRPRDDLYMLYVVVHGTRAELQRAWLVPSSDLESKGFQVAPNGKALQRFQASNKPDAQDMWRPYRLDAAEIVPALLAIVRQLDNAES
jgi:hypothetical protein